MFNRDIAPYKLHHLIPLIFILILILSSPPLPAQQQIAVDAYAILQQSCNICHGADGSFKETLLIEHNALIQNGTVVPGNPNTSELYNRLVTTEAAKRMPLGQPQLPAQSINTIRNWILAGAPDWTPTPTTDRDFISTADILNTIETHLNSLAPFDRAYARYFTMTHLYNAGEPVAILQEYRKGLNKLINSLSWGSSVINPTPIDTQETIFTIDIRQYEWDVNDAWGQIEAAYPYHIAFNAPTQTALKAQLGRLQTETGSAIPSVHVDWFIATASLPPLYHDLLSLPLTDRALETQLDVDVVRNLLNAPGVRVWRAGTNNSGVSNHNRVIERHTSRYGAYWKSYDFAGSVGSQNIFTHPLAFTHDGGEVVFNLPNGLQGYYITTASGTRLDAAPIGIVSNPAASDPTVRNGISCFGCHTEGMKTFDDEVRSVIESNTTPAFDKAQALRLYVEQSVMDGLIAEDMDRYETALKATGGAVDGIEPISRFHEAYQRPINADYAAAVLGLEVEVFRAKIGENVGLQRLGLLVLADAGGSMKRDAWTEGFDDVIFALDFPETEVDSPSQPTVLPGATVHIPDANLRAAVAETLGKSPNAPITAEEMGRLTRLEAPDRGIHDLTGLQFATGLEILDFRRNQVSNLSTLAGLINLKTIRFDYNPVSDLSPLRGLRNLIYIFGERSEVSDLSPIAGLIQLKHINIGFIDSPVPVIHDTKQISKLVNLEFLALHTVDDITPLAGLPKLEALFFGGTDNIRDFKPLSGLTNLKKIHVCCTGVSDLSPLAGLTKLDHLYLPFGKLSDLTPITGLTGLEELYVHRNNISDLSPIANLTELKRLDLHNNGISDISVLAALRKLEWVDLSDNKISDFSPLDGLSENIKLISHSNPAFLTDAPKIAGPWLWVVLPNTVLERDTDLLSKATNGTVIETEVATHGAIEGESVGDNVWTYRTLPPTGSHNIEDMLKHSMAKSVIYGAVFLYSPREQGTNLYVGSDDAFKVWLNGVLIYQALRHHGSNDYTDSLPVTLQQGRNVLLVAVSARNGFFGFAPGTEYTVATPGVGYTFSQTPIHTGDTFTLDISAENVFDLAGWQFDIAFDPTILEAIDVTEGSFLKTGSTTTFFQSGSIDNVAGKITGLSAARLSTQGVTGTGTLLQLQFKAKAGGETELALQKFQLASATGESILAGSHQIHITVEGRPTGGDVNRDGQVSIIDLVLVAQQLGSSGSSLPADINGDGVVSILDLIAVSQSIATSPAAPLPPPLLASRSFGSDLPPLVERQRNPDSIGAGGLRGVIESWIAQARLEDDGSLAFREGIANLEKLLTSLIPEETALLANYPNPFNPETWIPYQLAESGEVTLTIYDINGQLVRRLALGHRAAGMYQSRRRAAYWDGRNAVGELVASGVYFYTLKAGEFTATRRMLILK